MKLWKNRPSWFKGGIVLSCIFIILFVITLIIDPVGKVACGSGTAHPCFPYWWYPISPGIGIYAYFVYFLGQIGFSFTGVPDSVVLFLVGLFGLAISVPIYFGLGALIVIIFNWLKKDKFAWIGALLCGGIILLLGLISLISSGASRFLFGTRGVNTEIFGLLFIALVIGAIIGGIVRKIMRK